MKSRLIPPENTPQEAMHSAPLILTWGGNGHEREYVLSLPGLIGVRGDKEIPFSISNDLQRRLEPGHEVSNRGSRIEVLGARDDDFVVGVIAGYFNELSQLARQ